MMSIKKLGLLAGAATLVMAAGCKPSLDVTNPKTGEQIQIPASKTVRFSAGSILKQSL